VERKGAVLHAQVSVTIRAPEARVMELCSDHMNWHRLFPATIRGVPLVRIDRDTAVLAIDHVREGRVITNFRRVSPSELEIAAWKKRCSGRFRYRVGAAPGGTRFTVAADIAPHGIARLLSPLAKGYVRRQRRSYSVEPVKRAVESR
jgi:hypothetical protein